MATTIIKQVTDDLDGSANAEAVMFGYEGTTYEIDLAKKSKTALEKVLKPYIEAGRKTSGRGIRSSPKLTRSNGPKVDLSAVRAWAAEQGIKLSNRGRVAKDVLDAYEADH